MKISYSIFLTFGFILLLFSTTTFINFRLADAVKENSEYTSISTSIIKNSARFQRNILNMVNGLRGYLLTGERSFIESYDAATKENEIILQDLPSLITDSAQSKLLLEIKTLNGQWTEEYTQPLREAKGLSNVSGDNLQAFNKFYKEKFATGEEAGIQAKLQQKLKEFTNSEYGIRNAKKASLTISVNNTRRLSIILTAISFLTALVVIGFLIRRISGRIKGMTDMANTIASGRYDVQTPDTGTDELSSLGHSLNHMSGELSKNISLLKRSNAELDQFAHIVSHDMKGPLRGISNVVGWIEEDHANDLTVEVKDYLQLIKGRISRAENLIEGLLSYARADKEVFEKETVDIKDLVHEVLENIPESKRFRIRLSALPVLFSEKLLLYQLFSNLIGNAVKYNDKDNAEVKIYCKEFPDNYEFFIEDNGIGIAPAYHDRIFVIFQTLRDRDSFESTGVGLAIVKKILQSKGQEIKLISEPDKGSVFSFTWPKK